MKILVCGATGCVGRAVTAALRARGHEVVEAARRLPDGPRTLAIDFMQPRSPAQWAATLRTRGIAQVVNCVGVLMPARGQSFERVHTAGPIELFHGAAMAGVTRVVQVSALGVDDDPASLDSPCLDSPYLHSKRRADEALLASLPLAGVVLRPSLVYGPGSQSAALFATLASLPVIGLPGRGAQRVQPIHVYELAEAIVRLLEQAEPARGVLELGGGEALSYREMLAHYRRALGLGDALWLPVPMPLMRLGARLAEALPQQVFCRDTIALLERGSVPRGAATAVLLGRPATGFAAGLAVVPPQPMIDLRVQLSPAVRAAVRWALAFMWIYTAAISALLPQTSGVLALLARCGFEGAAGWWALAASCTLNTALGVALLRDDLLRGDLLRNDVLRDNVLRRGRRPWMYAVQCSAVLGYTATAALCMPELTLDHCGPLVKNLPVLVAMAVLWLDTGPQPVGRDERRAVAARVAPGVASGATPRMPPRGLPQRPACTR